MKITIRAISAILMIVALSGLNGCKKNTEEPPFIQMDATVTFQGLIASDGCGYVIIINNISYHPENLDKAYQADNLKVTISAYFTGKDYQCGMVDSKTYPTIRINSISKR